MWPRVWVEVYLYSSMTSALEGGEWSAARPGRTLPPGKTQYHFYRGLCGPQGEKSLPHRDSIPDLPARSSVAIPTELLGPRLCMYVCMYVYNKYIYMYIYTHTHTHTFQLTNMLIVWNSEVIGNVKIKIIENIFNL